MKTAPIRHMSSNRPIRSCNGFVREVRDRLLVLQRDCSEVIGLRCEVYTRAHGTEWIRVLEADWGRNVLRFEFEGRCNWEVPIVLPTRSEESKRRQRKRRQNERALVARGLPP
jgi:hypothetical protein